ncbi:MAG: hypothetical protein Q8J70_01210 [Thiobacillus sp.]|nr:hypothetical protein [Thiobacillus sp.]
MKSFHTILFVVTVLLLQACAPAKTISNNTTYPGPESYLLGREIESVASVYGNPTKSNTVGNTLFVSYTGFGHDGGSYSNICFLELQADSKTNKIKSVKLGSNLGIDGLAYNLNVRDDCNKVFYRTQLAK